MKGGNRMTQRNGESPQRVHDADDAAKEAWGASQIGPFDYVPKLGFREYWYPGVWAKQVGKRKPKMATMLNEDVVFFRSGDGSVAALTDWCPHRNARLSLGVSEFPGTITCPYHGYTFDSTGQCVAGLIDSPESPVVAKMKARHFPTQEFKGIVFVWMGETDPVPLEEDLPVELTDERNDLYTRMKVWETNWTEPVNQGVDFHEGYLHRKQFAALGGSRFKFHALFDKSFGFFRERMSFYGGVRVDTEGDNFYTLNPAAPQSGPQYHPGVNASWPQKRWWQVLKARRRGSGSPVRQSLMGTPSFQHAGQLPSIIRVFGSGPPVSVHTRWMVPITVDLTRTWTFTIGRRPKTWLGRLWKNVWYYFWRKPSIVVRTDEWEDLVVFMRDRLRFDLPQKLGPLDTGVIYFRRHLARRSRDFQRLGGAHGTVKAPPTRTADEWRAAAAAGLDLDAAPDNRGVTEAAG